MSVRIPFSPIGQNFEPPTGRVYDEYDGVEPRFIGEACQSALIVRGAARSAHEIRIGDSPCTSRLRLKSGRH